MPVKNQRKVLKNFKYQASNVHIKTFTTIPLSGFSNLGTQSLEQDASICQAYLQIPPTRACLIPLLPAPPPGKKLETGSNSDSLCRRHFPFLYLISPFPLAEGSSWHTTVRLDRISKHVQECCYKNGDRNTFCPKASKLRQNKKDKNICYSSKFYFVVKKHVQSPTKVHFVHVSKKFSCFETNKYIHFQYL